MKKIDLNTFEFLGEEFQIKLIANLINDKDFGYKIIDIINPKYFSTWELYFIFIEIKKIKDEKDIIIDLTDLILNIVNHMADMITVKMYLRYLKKINKASLEDNEVIKETALQFCKQQELLKAITEVQKIISRGKLEDYEVCERILKHTLEL